MRVAIVAAGYDAGEADQLRRSMAAWKRAGNMEVHRAKIIEGMLRNGYTEAFAIRCWDQIVGFSGYGFPESHAASFALLTYASCWLKCHEHAAFTCALLNSQPLGFYSTSQLTQDARRHSIEIRPIDVTVSGWDSSLEAWPDPEKQPAIRLGLREIRGLSDDAGERIVAARTEHAFRDVADLCKRAALTKREQTLLVEAGALKHLAGHRNDARWEVAGIEVQRPLFAESPEEDEVALPAPSIGEDLRADYASTGLTLGVHPVSLLRERLRKERCLDSEEVTRKQSGARVRVAGLVVLRQRPATAKGTTFVTLEDEKGNVQIIVWPTLGERQRKELVGSRLMVVDGRWDCVDGVGNLIADRLRDMSQWLGQLDTRSRDFH